MSLTLDTLIETLLKMKANGIDGTTPVGIPTIDNNGSAGYVELDAVPVLRRIAKDEFDKMWTVCRVVSRGGIPVIVVAG